MAAIARHTVADDLWLTEIAEHRDHEGKLFSARSRTCARTGSRIFDSRMKASLAVSALKQRSDAGPSSRNRWSLGSCRRSLPGVSTCALAQRITGLNGRTGAIGDNAAKSSFFALQRRRPRSTTALHTRRLTHSPHESSELGAVPTGLRKYGIWQRTSSQQETRY